MTCRRAWVQIAAATLSGNYLRQTVHTHRASVHQAAKLVAALLRVARVTAGLAESNGSLPSGLWLTSPAGWLPRTRISSGTVRSVIVYGLPLPFLVTCMTKLLVACALLFFFNGRLIEVIPWFMRMVYVNCFLLGPLCSTFVSNLMTSKMSSFIQWKNMNHIHMRNSCCLTLCRLFITSHFTVAV